MFDAVKDCFTDVIVLVGEFLSALTSGTLSGLLPLFAIGIAISLVLLSVRVVRKVTWGA